MANRGIAVPADSSLQMGPANRGILSTKERALGLRGNPGKKAKVLAMERLRTEAGRQTQEWQDAP